MRDTERHIRHGRRSHVRHLLELPATCEIAGQQARAVVVDVSASGLGLEVSGCLETGRRLDVHIPTGVSSGTTFRGTVVWARSGHCGMSFDRTEDAGVSLGRVLRYWLRCETPAGFSRVLDALGAGASECRAA